MVLLFVSVLPTAILTLLGFACLNYFVTKRKNSKVIHTLDTLDRKHLFCNKMFLLQNSYKVKVIKYGDISESCLVCNQNGFFVGKNLEDADRKSLSRIIKNHDECKVIF